MKPNERVHVNFFAPSTESMKAEVSVARIVLAAWAFLSFGIPTVIWLAGLGDPTGLGQSFFTEDRSMLGFPLHYWLLAQGSTIGFVILCKIYCILWDNLVVHLQKKRR